MFRSRHGTTRVTAGVAAALAVLIALPTPAAVAAPTATASNATAADPLRKVDPQVLAAARAGTGTRFFVEVAGEARLDQAELDRVERSAAGRAGRVARTKRVYETKVAQAEQAQRGLRSLLRDRHADFTPYWIANVVEVTGGLDLVTELARRAEVTRITPIGAMTLTEPVRTAGAAADPGLPWNLTSVGADKVWNEYGARGEGVVVGSLDSGVQYDHPALVRQYRGNNGDGTFTHDYNWFDPTGFCPPGTPCDNQGHGTHTTGSVLGDDGAGHVTGVAPGATWIAAKGCEANYCTNDSLLAAGQWMLAPTDLNGNNPRPELAPDIVNNSWGGVDDGNSFYDQIIDTWVAAGIFPVFAVGNEADEAPDPCGTAGYPGSNPLAYAVGATDSAGTIGVFSSRGPGRDGAVRPDITAPGVRILSTLPGGEYGLMDGSSMAAPHVTGAIALAWSAVPNLRRDLVGTRELLDRTAHDVADLQCGGTAADNNVYGEGRLDAYDLVTQASTAQLGGVVVHAVRGGNPLPGARITLTSDLVTRTARTDARGTVQLGRVPAGDYTLTATFFAQRTQRRTISVSTSGTVNLTLDLSESAPWQPVAGRVTDPAGKPVVGAHVTLADETFPGFVTGKDGRYTGMLPEADYDLRVEYGRWLAPKTVAVTVDGPETVDVTLAAKADRHGYTAGVARASWVDGGAVLPLTGDTADRAVELPFPMTFYGTTYDRIAVHTDGYLTFGADSAGSVGGNGPLPAPAVPAAAVYAFWDDLVLDHASTVRTKTTGSGMNRQFVVSWTRAALKSAPKTRVDVQVRLGENGTVGIQYRKLGDGSAAAGGSATVGIEDATGRDAVTYSRDEAVLDDATAVTFRVPGRGLLRGTIRDANDRQPLAGATVRVESPDARQPVTAVTDADGFYQLEAPAGTASLSALQPGYELPATTVTIAETKAHKQDLALRTPLLLANRDAVEVSARAGTTKTATVTLTNKGDLPATWLAREINSPTPPTGVPGKVLDSFATPDLYNAYGVGYRNGELIVSNSYLFGQLQKFSTDGRSLGKGVLDIGGWPSDMAYVAARDLMCAPKMSFIGDLPIVCFDPDTLEVKETITGPWAGKLYYGLAHRASDDTFYLAGDGKIQHLAGLSHPQPGAVLDECTPPVPWITGLALNEKHNVLWGINQDSKESIWALDPQTCQDLASVPDPDPNPLTGAGLDLDEQGNLWVLAGATGRPYRAKVYHVDGSLPAYSEVPWLSAATSGQVEPGAKQQLTITVDTTGLAPGRYAATLLVTNNGAKGGSTPVTVAVTVTR
ncbi:S8 family serine peptidase [Micromonospora krabiensis]|uniref:Serine protease, subtilisin family n=1 Tax=Micromonospora krabiensis TaxID=307121 RepID=A0A1C3N1B3_9ACTN|nr:S8 family serine peptidase [Micromonospora krabiensis]SBV26348.1 Serine protease, subtilisin family [Micromonospora krabiensis]